METLETYARGDHELTESALLRSIFAFREAHKQTVDNVTFGWKAMIEYIRLVAPSRHYCCCSHRENYEARHLKLMAPGIYAGIEVDMDLDPSTVRLSGVTASESYARS